MKLIAWDSETHPIGPGQVAPRIVCASFAAHGASGDVQTQLLGHPDGLRDAIEDLLLQAIAGEARLVTHNGGFDYACVCATWPELIPLVFAALESGNCTDTLWREKLLNLSTSGRLDHVVLPDGSRMEIRYSLADLERQYLGRDRSAEKDNPEAWRSHFDTFDGWTAEEMLEHAPDAYRYAIEDAEGTLGVHDGQEDRKSANRIASTKTEEFQLLSSFCLYLETAWGMATNATAVAEMRVQVNRVLARNKDLLVASGVLRPGCGPEPYVKQVERAKEIITDLCGSAEKAALIAQGDFDWAPWQPRLAELGIKFKAPVEESISEAALQQVAAAAYLRIGAIPSMTDGRAGKDGVRVPQIQLGDEQTEFLAAHDPVMAQYHVRKSLRKLVTNQLPILESAPVVHFRYDALKETTRTSSSGNRKGKPALYPAANGQQVPKKIEGGDLIVDPRSCYRPRDGTVFFDVDLHCLELACTGQVTHDLLGYSVHLEKYNAGCDLHAFLGAQLLLNTKREGAALEVQQAISGGTVDDQYQTFLLFKRCGDKALEKVFKDTRDFAKPVGLGYPGGLGAVKQVTFARKSYGVHMTEAEARESKEIWLGTYTEMRPYFDWISSQRDYHNDGQVDIETGKAEQLYWYTTPMGAVRRGCTYCSMANGKAMQSPGAEAAKGGNNAVVRACYDPSAGSVLYGARPIAFVHDQVIGETTLDPAVWHDQAMAVSALMIAAAQGPLPKVRMRTEPLLTRVWSKSAEPAFGEDGRLVPWEPKSK